MGHYAPMPRGRWVLTSLIPFGWVTWVGFLLGGLPREAGRRGSGSGSSTWLITAAHDLRSPRSTTTRSGSRTTSATSSCSRRWAVGIVQAFLTRKPYLRRLAIIDDPALAGGAERRASASAYARELAQRDPQLAREARIGRGGGFDEGGVVDVNHAPVEDIADLPGIDADDRAPDRRRRATASAASPRSRTSA